MPGQARQTDAQYTRALQLALGSGLGPITGTIVDGQPLGAFVACLNKTVAATDTTITVPIQRTPQGYILIRAQPNGYLYDGANHGSDWTMGSLVIRASVAGVYSFLVF